MLVYFELFWRLSLESQKLTGLRLVSIQACIYTQGTADKLYTAKRLYIVDEFTEYIADEFPFAAVCHITDRDEMLIIHLTKPDSASASGCLSSTIYPMSAMTIQPQSQSIR
jgi:hypothetical protein